MKEIFLTVIRRGSYDLTGILRRIDEYHIDGKLTDTEREELIAAARGDATPGVDPTSEVQKLWAEVRALTARVAKLEGTADSTGSAGDVPEYVNPTGAHDAYYAGALVKYNGRVYKCIAPDGMACAWSPDVMPAYWEQV